MFISNSLAFAALFDALTLGLLTLNLAAVT